MDKKFVLSSSDKKIAGVCGGIAEYFGVTTDYLLDDTENQVKYNKNEPSKGGSFCL